MIVMVAMAVLFLVLGLVFRSGRGAALIAGYNTASQKEKDTIDEKKLCRYTGNLMFILAGCQMFFVFSVLFETKMLLWIGVIAFLISVVGGVVFLNTGDRLKK